ncbi:MAG TPA: ComF family protein [Candidatus Saccharimonadales bacterium]
MTTILEKLFQNIAPHDCIMCCNEGHILCPICAPDLINEQFSRCLHCELPTVDYALCAKCYAHSPISHAVIISNYENELKQLVRLLKYEHVRQAATDIARAWEHILPVFPKETIVTHVPTTNRRQRARGFDQAELLARALAKQKQLTYASLLRRVGNTKQVGASRQQRFRQAATMFELAGGLYKDRLVLLVDDVITTGATIRAAATLLRQAGAKQVIAVAIARQHLEKH